MNKKIGLFGGSFNPIHNGHLYLAETVMQQMKLDGVMLMPAGKAPHKDCSDYAPAEDRLEMCKLAAMPYPWMQVSDREIRKTGYSYTAETLQILHEDYADIDWTLLLGSDMLLTFSQWRNWQDILSMAQICVVSREHGDYPKLLSAAERLRGMCPGAKIYVLFVRAFPVSSTQIRHDLQNYVDCSCFLPKNVVQYIRDKGLYRGKGKQWENQN